MTDNVEALDKIKKALCERIGSNIKADGPTICFLDYITYF